MTSRTSAATCPCRVRGLRRRTRLGRGNPTPGRTRWSGWNGSGFG